jgi:putative oxidoreductase
VHWPHGLFAAANGIELPLLYAAIAVALALTGPGAYSVDAALGLTRLWTPALSAAVLAAGAIAAGLNLGIGRRAVVEV